MPITQLPSDWIAAGASIDSSKGLLEEDRNAVISALTKIEKLERLYLKLRLKNDAGEDMTEEMLEVQTVASSLQTILSDKATLLTNMQALDSVLANLVDDVIE